MTRGAAGAQHPWSMKVAVEQIPEAGLHHDLVANSTQLAGLRELGALRELSDVRAAFDVSPAGRGRVQVTGRVTARVGQVCVVTLDPVESMINETVDLLFAPEDQVAAIVKAMEDQAKTDEEQPDPPEAITEGMIDLGQLAADALFLGINPYPRKPDAAFEPPPIVEDPESHPFAALKALKDTPASPPPKKPKNKKE